MDDDPSHRLSIGEIPTRLQSVVTTLNPNSPFYDDPSLAHSAEHDVTAVLKSLEYHFSAVYPTTSPATNDTQWHFQNLIDQLQQAVSGAHRLQYRTHIAQKDISELRGLITRCQQLFTGFVAAMNNDYDLRLRELLIEHFNLNELQDLCYIAGIDYDIIQGSEKLSKVRELILYARRHGLVDRLLVACQQLRPTLDWPGMPNPTQSDKASKQPPQIYPDDELDYEIEVQPWFVAQFPRFERIGSQKNAREFVSSIDIVLLTVNEHEFHAVMHLLRPLPGQQAILAAHVEAETYYLGQYGAAAVAVSRCEMGAHQPGSASIATQQAQTLWLPRAIIMVGIAFGANRTTQRIGDVLVAKDIIPYNPQRVGKEIIYRGRHMPADQTLLNRFKNALDWDFQRPDKRRCRIHSGDVLSGEELIDNLDRKERLLRISTNPIGGEMEGTGLSASAIYGRTPWSLVKAICDWADGSKTDKHQQLAAAAAASLVHHVLNDHSAFESLTKPNSSH